LNLLYTPFSISGDLFGSSGDFDTLCFSFFFWKNHKVKEFYNSRKENLKNKFTFGIISTSFSIISLLFIAVLLTLIFCPDYLPFLPFTIIFILLIIKQDPML
jgi:hypothetical protein